MPRAPIAMNRWSALTPTRFEFSNVLRSPASTHEA